MEDCYVTGAQVVKIVEMVCVTIGVVVGMYVGGKGFKDLLLWTEGKLK